LYDLRDRVPSTAVLTSGVVLLLTLGARSLSALLKLFAIFVTTAVIIPIHKKPNILWGGVNLEFSLKLRRRNNLQRKTLICVEASKFQL